MLYQFTVYLNFSEKSLHMRELQRAKRFFLFSWMTSARGVNNRVFEAIGIAVEAMRITIKLKIMSESADFITQILSSLVYGASSFMKTALNLFSGGWLELQLSYRSVWVSFL
jgi:hypothetical protein